MYTALLIVLLVLIAACAILLFTPLMLVVDTTRDLYRAQWGPANAWIRFVEERVRYHVHIPFWTKEGDLDDLFRSREWIPERGGTHAGPPAKEVRRTREWRPPVRALLGTFHVRRFRLTIDTGDPLWNAWLYPVLHWFHRRGHAVSISFTGRNELVLTLSNNLYRVIKAVLLSKPFKNPKR